MTSKGFTTRGITAQIISTLNRKVVVFDEVQPNPELDALDLTTTKLRSEKITGEIALCGSSAIDSGKVLSATLLT